MSKLTLIARLRRLPRYLVDRTVPVWKKLLLLFGALYTISPVDAFPELFIPIIGWLDDLGLLTVLTLWMYRELGTTSKERARELDSRSGEREAR